MASFDAILNNLHDNSQVRDDAGQEIEITKKRTFVVPADYDLVLGYVGDVNSQAVTFRFPYTHETHCLYNCTYKVVKWKNLKSGAEGESKLIPSESAAEPSWTGVWEVPPEVMTGAGNVEVSFSLYDVSDGLIAFAWNTPSFNGFSVGEGFGDVGDAWEKGEWLPAKNEILTVNIDTRTIIEPNKFNTVVANFGDMGTSKVFFVIDKRVRGMDIWNGPAAVCVNYSLGGTLTQKSDGTNEITQKQLYKTDSESKTEKILLVWDLPKAITLNSMGYVGPITISIEVYIKNEKKEITKRWVSSSYSRLTIGQSLLQTDPISVVERNEEIIRELVNDEINDYMDDTYFVTSNDVDPKDYTDN
jgi:hypothetical protein